eukprot:TRINITY_DN38864_c0_g1_i1.p1 TRINITY_DN38864_c0_g1~~TRINITY_DN38864_c0_g1_i1.p1  ORF type:complete len:795 (+),score=166.88 TRINITY_DN38864_c0_g1_i1:107-2491(+)
MEASSRSGAPVGSKRAADDLAPLSCCEQRGLEDEGMEAYTFNAKVLQAELQTHRHEMLGLLKAELSIFSKQMVRNLKSDLQQLFPDHSAGQDDYSATSHEAPVNLQTSGKPKSELGGCQDTSDGLPSSIFLWPQPPTSPTAIQSEQDSPIRMRKYRTYTFDNEINNGTSSQTPTSPLRQRPEQRRTTSRSSGNSEDLDGKASLERRSVVFNSEEPSSQRRHTLQASPERRSVDGTSEEQSNQRRHIGRWGSEESQASAQPTLLTVSKRPSKTAKRPKSIFMHQMAMQRPGTELTSPDSSDNLGAECEDQLSGAGDGQEVSGSSSQDMRPRRSFCASVRSAVAWLVNQELFDYFMGTAILVNAGLMGVQADFAVKAARSEETEPDTIRLLAAALGLLFGLELCLRIVASGKGFFVGEAWQWNIFDLLVVTLQMGEELLESVAYMGTASVNLSFMRILRILRLVRIIRLVRVLRLIRELRTLVQSIASTMTSLLWTMALLGLLIFVVGICFTQMVANVGSDDPEYLADGEPAFEYYGSLARSVLSLYQCITNGVSWRTISEPLESKQPFMAIAFSIYIAFAMLAMLNVITGVFVESAMASAKEEYNLDMVSRLREVVAAMELGEESRMTWEQFESQLNNPTIDAYFKSLDLSLSEAMSLFMLLDVDDEGSIDKDEFVAGCCRIHGYAKAVDLTALMCQVTMMHRQWLNHALWVEDTLYALFSSSGRKGCSLAMPRRSTPAPIKQPEMPTDEVQPGQDSPSRASESMCKRKEKLRLSILKVPPKESQASPMDCIMHL